MTAQPEDRSTYVGAPKRLWLPWWLATIIGVVGGISLTFLRAHKEAVIPGALTLAALVIFVGVATILRRKKHPEALRPPVSAWYVLWTAALIYLAGPAQVFFLPANPQEIIIKAIVVSLGLSVAIYGADRSLFSSFAKPITA